MLKKIAETGLRHRALTIMVACCAVVAGAWSLFTLPIDSVPDITNTQVVVNAKTGALDPEQVEKSVTHHIESELAGLPRVTDIRSHTKVGLSHVVVTFTDGTDVYWARQQVTERLQNVRELLPQGIAPELGPVTAGLGEVLIYAVRAKKGSAIARAGEKERLTYLRTVQDFVVRPALKSSIPNTAEVDTLGGYKKEIHVNLEPGRLARHGLTIQDIVKKLDMLGENSGGGYIENRGRQVIVRTDGTLTGLDEIGNVPVKLSLSGGSVRLGAIANVREGHARRFGAATCDGNETVIGTVLMLQGANSRQVAMDAENALRELKLPADVETEVLYSRGFLVGATIRTVIENLALGAALVVIVLLLLLGNARAAVIVSLSIPVSMLLAATGMKFFGISANLMSLGAVDFGLLVDGSVVIVENLMRKIDARAAESPGVEFREKLAFFVESCGEVIRPVVYGIVIIMIVYVPILSLEGVEGKMFRPMAMTVLMAVGASLLVTVLLMPVLAYVFLRRADGNGARSPLFGFIDRHYRRALDCGMRRRAAALALIAVLGTASLVLFVRNGSDFVPPLDEGDMSIAFVRDFSIGPTEAVEVQKRCERIIKGFPEVRRVFAQTGTSESATDSMGSYMSDTFLILEKDRGRWPKVNGRRRTKDELFLAIKKKIEAAMPGQEMLQSQPIELRFNEILEGSRSDVTLRIYGPDLEKLSDIADRAEDILKPIPGAAEVEMDPITSLRRSAILNITPDLERINRYGLSLKDVNNTIEAAMDGKRVGSFHERDRRFPVMVRMADEARDSAGGIAALPVPLEDGGTIPLSAIAKITEVNRVTNIARNNARRYSAISINLAGRDTLGYVKEAREKISRGLKLPEGYEIYWGGQFKNLERARARLLIIIPVVLTAIFIIIYGTFKSVRQTLLVFASIPFAVTGGVISLSLAGMHFSVSASVGFIALSGIAILNGLVMMTMINQLRERGMPLREAVTAGAVTRLRPVVMTALVASLGFLPMAVNTGIGAEVQRPLATVVIGGLITSTILTLILLPSLYLMIEKE